MQSKIVVMLAASSLFACGAFAQMNGSMSNQASMTKPKMSMSQATKIAMQTEPGKITSKELENEGGKQIYSYDIQTTSGATHEVNIDANTGAVIADQVESKADEMNEAKQDKMAAKKKHEQKSDMQQNSASNYPKK